MCIFACQPLIGIVCINDLVSEAIVQQIATAADRLWRQRTHAEYCQS
jgi:hypothetical protein